jgi:hypothetical protein
VQPTCAARFKCASALFPRFLGTGLARPVVHQVLGPAWSIGACGASSSSHTS